MALSKAREYLGGVLTQPARDRLLLAVVFFAAAHGLTWPHSLGIVPIVLLVMGLASLVWALVLIVQNHAKRS